MWKVFLAFATHRALLLMVALLTLSSTSSKMAFGGSLYDRFLRRAAEGPEVATVVHLSKQSLGQVVTESRNPFHWVVVAMAAMTGMSPLVSLILFSNLFLLLFLFELFQLFNRMVTTDISTLAATFVLLWPTSYELSLGSSLPLAGFFLTLSLRQGLEQNWWMAGLAVSVLALMDPIAITLIPVFLYLFWGVQRFLPLAEWGRNAAIFLGMLALGVFLSERTFAATFHLLGNSAMVNLIHWSGPGGEGLFSHGLAGQTISLIFFFLGAVGALFSNVNPMHRFLPMGVLLALVLASPYGALASRAPLAGICMEGIASASSGTASRIACALMILLGAYEVYSVFLV